MNRSPLITRRPIPLAFLGMLALIWAVEAFVSRNDRWFSIVEADTWRSARVATEHLPTGGVLILGDSQALFGMSPLTVQSRLSRPVRCLALPGGQASSTYFMLRRALQAGTVPAAIVVNFEAELLRVGRSANQRLWPELTDFDECLDLAVTLGEPDAFASMLLAEFLPSYRERTEIRSNLMLALRGETPPMPIEMAMGRRNRRSNQGALLFAKLPPGTQHQDDPQWAIALANSWKPNPVNKAYAHRFFQLAQRHKIPVFCTVMPVVDKLKQKMVGSGLEPAYRSWLHKLQDRYANLVVLDYRDAHYPDSVFVDLLHLDIEGSASVGLAAADQLQRSLRGEGSDDRWIKMPPFRTDGAQVALEDHVRSLGIVRAADSVLR